PLQVVLVGGRHVFGAGGVAIGGEVSYMGRHPFSLQEGLHRVGGQPDMEFLSQELVGNAVVMSFYLDVVVDIDRSHFPLGIFVGSLGKGSSLGAIEQIEKLAPRLLYLTKG